MKMISANWNYLTKKELNQLDILQDQVISHPSEDSVAKSEIKKN